MQLCQAEKCDKSREIISTLIKAVFCRDKSTFIGKENQKPQWKADNTLCQSVNNSIEVFSLYKVTQSQAGAPKQTHLAHVTTLVFHEIFFFLRCTSTSSHVIYSAAPTRLRQTPYL